MWVRELTWIEPTEAAARLAPLGSVCFLDSAMPHPLLGRYSYVAADPFGVFGVRDGRPLWNDAPVSGPPMQALRRHLSGFRIKPRAGLPPFQGGAIGYFGYEFGWALEGRKPPAVEEGAADVRLAFHDVIVAFDHVARACWLFASGFPAEAGAWRRQRAEARLDLFAERLSRSASPPGSPQPAVWRAETAQAAYKANVEQVKAYIRAGDIYQANIAQRFVASIPQGADPWGYYLALRSANPAPFAAYLDCGRRQILSTSPELFLRCAAGQVETRPIKGTARRADDPAEDGAVAARLLRSRKDRAENVMIVDLLRNDLSRVCAASSVGVPSLCDIESYAGLHHLVSSVTGELAPGRDALDLLAASFPGGSITGAPKIRAMEIIAELEQRPRGVYCGAVGAVGFDGSLNLNIAIRTVVFEEGRMELCTGGGITILSDPQAEYEETLTKARRLLEAVSRTPHSETVDA